MTPKVTAEMAQMPAASPSRPSMKFTMLMMAANQRTVITMEAASGRCSVSSRNGNERLSMRTDKAMEAPMAAS